LSKEQGNQLMSRYRKTPQGKENKAELLSKSTDPHIQKSVEPYFIKKAPDLEPVEKPDAVQPKPLLIKYPKKVEVPVDKKPGLKRR
jgi:hypothetical protein